jgi:hypothetical protein
MLLIHGARSVLYHTKERRERAFRRSSISPKSSIDTQARHHGLPASPTNTPK